MQKSSLDEAGQDKDAQNLYGLGNEILEFLPLDDIPEDKNIDLDDANTILEDIAVPRVPLELVPLGDDEKKNDSTLFTRQGVVFGNRSDFKVRLVVF